MPYILRRGGGVICENVILPICFPALVLRWNLSSPREWAYLQQFWSIYKRWHPQPHSFEYCLFFTFLVCSWKFWMKFLHFVLGFMLDGNIIDDVDADAIPLMIYFAVGSTTIFWNFIFSSKALYVGCLHCWIIILWLSLCYISNFPRKNAFIGNALLPNICLGACPPWKGNMVAEHLLKAFLKCTSHVATWEYRHRCVVLMS